MRITYSKRGYFHSLGDDDLRKLIMTLCLPQGKTERNMLQLALHELDRRQKEDIKLNEKRKSIRDQEDQ